MESERLQFIKDYISNQVECAYVMGCNDGYNATQYSEEDFQNPKRHSDATDEFESVLPLIDSPIYCKGFVDAFKFIEWLNHQRVPDIATYFNMKPSEMSGDPYSFVKTYGPRQCAAIMELHNNKS